MTSLASAPASDQHVLWEKPSVHSTALNRLTPNRALLVYMTKVFNQTFLYLLHDTHPHEDASFILTCLT